MSDVSVGQQAGASHGAVLPGRPPRVLDDPVQRVRGRLPGGVHGPEGGAAGGRLLRPRRCRPKDIYDGRQRRGEDRPEVISKNI